MSENRFRSKKLIRVLIVIAAFVVLIQVIPYGHGHINPPVTVQPVWDSPQTRETFMRTCGCDEIILSIMLVGADRDAVLHRALQWVGALS